MTLFTQLDVKKINKLIEVAKKYYFDGMTQNQIAKELNLSRPLISKYLAEARDVGIVTISIKSPLESDDLVIDLLKNRYGIQGGKLDTFLWAAQCFRRPHCKICSTVSPRIIEARYSPWFELGKYDKCNCWYHGRAIQTTEYTW